MSLVADSISVITCSKNRDKYLEDVVRSTKNLDNLNEHLIIDFSSDNKISESLLEINPKVKIVRVSGEKDWWLSRAYNFGFFLSKSSYILKLDADSILNAEACNELKVFESDYLVFNHNKGLGNFFVKKSLLLKLNGFNEYIFNWGYEDIDLYNRIEKEKHHQLRILRSKNFIEVLQHSDMERFNSERMKHRAASRAFSKVNSFISKNSKWDNNKKLTYQEVDKDTFTINHNFTIQEFGFLYLLKIKSLFMNVYLNEAFNTNLFNKIPYLTYFLPMFSINKFLKINLYPKKINFL